MDKVFAAIIVGGALTAFAIWLFARHMPEVPPEERPLLPDDLTDSGGSAYTTKDDGPIHRSAEWWRERGAK